MLNMSTSESPLSFFSLSLSFSIIALTQFRPTYRCEGLTIVGDSRLGCMHVLSLTKLSPLKTPRQSKAAPSLLLSLDHSW